MPYSEEKANRVINFILQLKLTKGKWAGKPFTLLPWEIDLIKKTFDDTQSIEVSFGSPVRDELLASPRISNIEQYGDKMKIYTHDPDHVVKDIVSFAQQNDIPIISLTICGPSLEEAFVKLTGDKK